MAAVREYIFLKLLFRAKNYDEYINPFFFLISVIKAFFFLFLYKMRVKYDFNLCEKLFIL